MLPLIHGSGRALVDAKPRALMRYRIKNVRSVKIFPERLKISYVRWAAQMEMNVSGCKLIFG
jgi:hypothetical protein